MSDNFAQFQDAFFEEAAEHLAIVEEGLLALEQHPDDLDLLSKIFRSAHSIKGTSGMFGFNAVAQFTHKMETLLDRLRNGQSRVTPQIADLLLKATDCLKSMIDAAKTGAPVDEETAQRFIAELAAASDLKVEAKAKVESGASLSAPLPLTPSSSRCFHIAWTPPAWLFQRGLDPLQTIKELDSLGTLSEVQVDAAKLPDLVTMDPETCYLSWTMKLETAKGREVVEAVFEFVREESVLVITEEVRGKESGVRGEEMQASHGPPAAPHPSRLTPDGGDSEPKPLGEILVETGVVSRQTLDHALAQQKRVGEILIEQRAVTPQQVEQALQKQQESVAQSKKTDTASIRVDTAKIDKLINLVGELVITQSMLSDLGSRFEMGQMPVLLERMAQLERNTREIQERVMGIRMLPIGTAFSRFPRLVRDLSSKAGKKIQLVLTGEET